MKSGSHANQNQASPRTSVDLPKSHELLDHEQVESFADWLDPQLETLENQFREYWTQSSFKNSLSR